jgi:hypothetical protein
MPSRATVMAPSRSNSGLRKAQDFQLKLSTGKREQGSSFTGPKEAEASFTEAAAQFIGTSAWLKASESTRRIYLGVLNGAGITLTQGTAVPRRQRAAEEDDDESASGFAFITDDQVRTLAGGGTFPGPSTPLRGVKPSPACGRATRSVPFHQPKSKSKTKVKIKITSGRDDGKARG